MGVVHDPLVLCGFVFWLFHLERELNSLWPYPGRGVCQLRRRRTLSPLGKSVCDYFLYNARIILKYTPSGLRRTWSSFHRIFGLFHTSPNYFITFRPMSFRSHRHSGARISNLLFSQVISFLKLPPRLTAPPLHSLLVNFVAKNNPQPPYFT